VRKVTEALQNIEKKRSSEVCVFTVLLSSLGSKVLISFRKLFY